LYITIFHTNTCTFHVAVLACAEFASFIEHNSSEPHLKSL